MNQNRKQRQRRGRDKRQFTSETQQQSHNKYSTQQSTMEENSMRRCSMDRDDRAKVVAEIKEELKGTPELPTKYYPGSRLVATDSAINKVLSGIEESDPKWEEGPDLVFEEAEIVEYVQRTRSNAANQVVHNFASAKNEGGGFKRGRGALAQEEALCMCTNLWSSLSGRAAAPYYRDNNASQNMNTGLYTHGILYTPEVTFNRSGSLAEPPFEQLPVEEQVVTSVITAPAVNYGFYRQKVIDKGQGSEATAVVTTQERLDRLLLICLLNGKRHLITGPWGCGVFGGKVTNLMWCFKKSPYTQYFKSIHFISPDADTVAVMEAEWD